MPDEIQDQIEDLRLHVNEFAGATQFASFHVDRALTKQDAHGSMLMQSGRHPRFKLAGF
jgi:hypothetical protein